MAATGAAEPRVLYGRDREIAVLNAMLARVNEHGDSLVIRGDPGIGKSALVAAAGDIATASGFRVLTTTGVQSEAELAFAGLHQLLRNLPWTFDALPGPQKEALLAAFGRSSSSVPDPFLIALATLELLAEAASRAPLLIVAEDAQWLDRPTCNVLTFVARRLQADPIVVLLAVRENSGTSLLGEGLSEMRLGPLNRADATKVLEAIAPQVSSRVRRRILDDARGNPLALVELPLALRSETRWYSSIPPATLQLTATLESAFNARFLELPENTRMVLLVAAVDDSSDLAEVLAAATHLGSAIAVDALAAAEAARLIEVRGGEVQFRHPLVRSAIQQSATLANRMAAHAALADTLEQEPDRRAWHRASAVIGRDDAVAQDLDRVAETTRARGAAVISVAALQRAAELTADPKLRLDRLLRAAETAFEVGRRDLVADIVENAEPLMPLVQSPLERGRIALVRGLRGSRVLRPDRLQSLVATARQARDAGDTNLAWNLLWRLAQRCFWADPGPEARSIIVQAAEETESENYGAPAVAVLAYAAPIERANVVLDLITSWQMETADAEEARLLGSAAVVVGAFDLAMPFLSAAVAGLRAQGRLGHLARALTMQGWGALCQADWQVAIPALDEAFRMATETGETAWAAGARAMQAIIAALRGEPEAVAALSVEAEGAAISAGATHMLAYTHVARGVAALGDGRADDAYDEFQHIYRTEEPAHHVVPACWYIGEFAEVAVRSGHTEAAHAVIGELAPLVDGSRSPWIRSAFTFARVQLADDGHFEERVQYALSPDQASRWPFQRARLQLAYGSWLRRQRRVAEARPPLRSSRDALDALGIPAWAERARQELRAAGEASQKRQPEVWDQLSPQEMQIANMAAEGLSNREIAQRLYLSPRTVGSHLYRLFPKLGITSRAQLVAALARA